MADQLHFPLIELALTPSLGELLQESLNFILEKNNDELRYALRMHRDFSALIMQGGGNDAIIESLSELVGGEGFLVDQRGTVIGGSDGRMIACEASFLQGQIQAAAAGIRASGGRVTEFCLLSSRPEERHEVVMHIIELPYNSAFLVLLGPHLADSPLPRLAIEQAANVIGFELVKQQALKERFRRYKDEFFEELIAGKFSSPQEIVSIGKRYGLQDATNYLCIVGKKDEADQGEYGGKLLPYQHRDHIYELLKTRLDAHELPALLFNNKEMFVIVLQRGWDTSSGDIPLAPCLTQIQEELELEEKLSFSFGISNQIEQVTQLPNAYKEAVSALHTGYQSRQTRFIHFYRTKEVFELLKMVPDVALTDFCQETFQGLLEVDSREKADLMDTARVFLETQGQIAETAKRLFVHRNTVAYRLTKFEQLTRCSLRDPGDSLRFRLAFLAEKLR
ncbi:Purine catabolism regulatory protein [compost metagenome]